MQLGARWRVGDAPHRSVPPSLFPTIAAQELRFPDASAWTLTWLEGRPRLQLDDAVRVSIDAKGAVTVHAVDGEAQSGPAGEPGGSAGRAPGLEDDDDDDDWLT